MDLEDIAALGFLFGGFELLETLATVAAVLAVLAVFVGAVLLLEPDVATVLAMLGVAAGSAVGGGLVGVKVERYRREALG